MSPERSSQSEDLIILWMFSDVCAQVWTWGMDPIFASQVQTVDSWVFFVSWVPSQLPQLKKREQKLIVFLMQRCCSFPLQASQKLWKKWKKKREAEPESLKENIWEILAEFLGDCINFEHLGKNTFVFLLVYCICSSRAIKSVGTIVCEAACDPCCFFLPSSPQLNFKSFPHYCQMLLAAKKINAANHLPLTGELQVLPTGRTDKHFLQKATVCFH